jgi:hypothetical protein
LILVIILERPILDEGPIPEGSFLERTVLELSQNLHSQNYSRMTNPRISLIWQKINFNRAEINIILLDGT